jgi:tetratricopeptide (TPR) repeat protein
MRHISDPSPAVKREIFADEPERVRKIFLEGTALHGQGELAKAKACFAEVLGLQPWHAEALHAMGVIAAQTGQPKKAIKLIDQALKIRPEFAIAYYNRGNALKDVGHISAAIASYDRALAIQPNLAKAARSRRLLLQSAKRTASTPPDDKAAPAQPSKASAKQFYKTGLKLQEVRRYEEAVTSFNSAITLKPDFAEAYCGRGIALKGLGRFEDAVASYDRAVAIRPDFAQAWYNRALALQDLENHEDAIKSYDHAIAASPGYALAHCARGIVLLNTGRAEEAVAACDQAIAIDAGFAKAHATRGAALQLLQRMEEAIASYDRAIAIQPDFIEALWNRSLALLLNGDYQNGWQEYEWRWKNENLRMKLRWRDTHPVWRGEHDLAGKTLLLHAEQGLGDTLQFCRYAKLAHDRGARVILEVQPALRKLLGRVDGVAEVVARREALPEFHAHCPLMSLPLAFRTSLKTIPFAGGYIDSDPRITSVWRKKLGRKRKPRIGLVWSGSTKHKGDGQRSIALQDLLPLLSEKFEFVSLQKDLRRADAALLRAHPEIRHFGAELEDFTDTAALCELMDLVISVDTSVAHLAGAMGKPVWILLPFAPDWRWLLDRKDSPWYSSARLYRQAVPGNWAAVIRRVGADLSLDKFSGR